MSPRQDRFRDRHPKPGERGPFTCPACGGVLDWEASGEKFGCEVAGHEFAPGELAELQRAAVERALGTALRLVDEHVVMLRAVAEARAERGEHEAAAELAEKAQHVKADGDVLWDAVVKATSFES